MSANPASDPAARPPVEQLTYEQAFAELEEIVAELESGEHSLDTALAVYERGQALARRCTALLDQAELRIQQLSGDSLVDFVPAE